MHPEATKPSAALIIRHAQQFTQTYPKYTERQIFFIPAKCPLSQQVVNHRGCSPKNAKLKRKEKKKKKSKRRTGRAGGREGEGGETQEQNERERERDRRLAVRRNGARRATCEHQASPPPRASISSSGSKCGIKGSKHRT